jgi:hypothetical protein
MLKPGGQAEEGGEGVWHPEERDPDPSFSWRTGIAREPLCPREPVMCPLRSQEKRRRVYWLVLEGLLKLHLDLLATHELHGCSAMLPAVPISPEQRSCPDFEGMQQQAHPTRLCRLRAVPLTLLAQGAHTTVTDPGGVEHSQAAISEAVLFGWVQRLARRTAQGPVWLKRKGFSREAASFPGGGGFWRAIARLRGLHRTGKLSRTQRLKLKHVAQFESQVPHPLRHDLPDLLPTRSVRTPAIRVLLLVFIGKSRRVMHRDADTARRHRQR